MSSFCERASMDARSIRFMFDGSVLHPEATAEGLGMEDDDEIDAMLSQVGGTFKL
jgi:small ubiquitin-related modifier